MDCSVWAVVDQEKAQAMTQDEEYWNNQPGWVAAKIQCDMCNYIYVSVYWHECERLECPNCTMMATFDILENCSDFL